MSAVLRLYPRAWRERYGDELVALLEDHPPTLADHIDLIRGAFDARLHPQVPGAAAPAQEIPMDRKVFGFLAAIGGFAWIAAVASLYLMPHPVDGESDGTVAVLAILAGMCLTGFALGELGTREGSAQSAMTGHLIAGGSVVLAFLLFLPWPILAIGYLGFMPLAILASIRGAANHAFSGRIAVAFFIAAPLALVAGIGVAPVSAVPILPMGLASLLLALSSFTSRAERREVSPV